MNLNNYCKSARFYKATEWQTIGDDEQSQIWIGFKVDESQSIILDAKWNARHLSEDEQVVLDKEMDALVGTKL
tara:strand:+ start:6018 stop:6236 length:219 start_codon:yes stop_codon:yes gene_type:complete